MAAQPEQDTPNLNGDGDALPTYEDLAAQKGPNSRQAFHSFDGVQFVLLTVLS
jgi:hypothetical protein